MQGKNSKSLSITLNIDEFLISEIKRDKNIIDKDYINWYETNIINQDYKKVYDLFYFPLIDEMSYFTLSIKKEIKNNLLSCSSDLGYSLRYLSVDIFSSATLLKLLKNIDSFLIWKIGKNNNHYLLKIVDNKVSAYCNFKKQSNSFIDIIKIGDPNIISKMNDLLNSVLIKNKKPTLNNIFIYQTNNNDKLIKNILSNNFSNVQLFDIVKLFDSTSSVKSIKSSKFVENGVSFRGLDV